MGNIIGSRIKEVRKAKGITQKQLAKEIGYSSQQSIAHLENSDKAPRYEVVEKIAHALGVHTSELYPPVIDFTKKPTNEAELKEWNEALKEFNIAIELSDQLEFYFTWFELIEKSYEKLNTAGKHEAAKRIYELTLIPEYTKKD